MSGSGRRRSPGGVTVMAGWAASVSGGLSPLAGAGHPSPMQLWLAFTSPVARKIAGRPRPRADQYWVLLDVVIFEELTPMKSSLPISL